MLDSFTLLLQSNQLLFLSLMGVVGLCVGSFLNVAIYRLPIMLEQQWATLTQQANPTSNSPPREPLSLWLPRSHCPHCKNSIPPYHTIPILSYLLLRGRSACCGKQISLRYPLIEFFTAGVTLLVCQRFGLTWPCLAALTFSWAAITLAAIDLDHKILPDTITLPLLWLGLLLNTAAMFTRPESAIWGAALGYSVFWLIAFSYKKWRHVDGLGQGDVKLLAVCGAWLGWEMLPMIILFSSLLGVIGGSAYLIAQQKNRTEHIPFGPFILLASWVAMLWGQDILSAYFNFCLSP